MFSEERLLPPSVVNNWWKNIRSGDKKSTQPTINKQFGGGGGDGWVEGGVGTCSTTVSQNCGKNMVRKKVDGGYDSSEAIR